MHPSKDIEDFKRPSNVLAYGSTAEPSAKRTKKIDSTNEKDAPTGNRKPKPSTMVKRDWMSNRSYPALSFSCDYRDDLPIPDYVISVIEQFCENQLASGCVPSNLKEKLDSYFPTERFLDSNFSADFDDSEDVLQIVTDTVKESTWLHANRQGEAKWAKLTAKLLEYSTKPLSLNGQKHQPVVTRDVALETLHDKEFFSKIGLNSKLNHVLLLNHTVEPFKSLLSEAVSNGILLNPFTRAHTAKTIVVLGIEVKSPIGDSLAPAELQVGVWATKTGCTYDMFNSYGKAAAADTSEEDDNTAYMNVSRPTSDESIGPDSEEIRTHPEEIKPIISITVLGPIWNLHISYRNPMGNYVILGPYPLGHTSTAFGTFKILRCLNIAREYSVKEIWPWVAERLEAAIKRIKESPP